MKILVVGDPHGVLPKKVPKNVDLIFIIGDLPKSDLARKFYLGKSEEEVSQVRKNSFLQKKIYLESYDYSLKVAKYYSKFAPSYSLLGNVGNTLDSKTKREEKELGIKLPYIRFGLGKIKNFHIAKNCIRNFGKLKIGFLEYFLDECWIKEFEGNRRGRANRSTLETAKAKQVLNGFGNVDVLISHQPPYGYLDKISGKYGAPKRWWGKHAGSKVVLNYIKKYQPRYVFCGHIHEGKGHVKIGKTDIYNVGCCGDYLILDTENQKIAF